MFNRWHCSYQNIPDALAIQTNASLTRARKVGISYANHEIIAFVDNDVFIAENGFMYYILMFSLSKYWSVLFPSWIDATRQYIGKNRNWLGDVARLTLGI